jgi:valyl-tRNA synthetase
MKIEWSLLPVEDRWILSRLNRTIAGITSLMEDFQFGEAQRQIYDFLWGDFCDWYIEIAKIRLRSEDALSPIPVLIYVLEASLRLLHPYMPFVTEELWQNLKQHLPPDWPATESIMIAAYPIADETAIEPEAERIMESIIEIIHSIRNARAQYKVESTRWIEAQIYAGKLKPAIAPYSQVIQTLAKVKPVTVLASRQGGQSDGNALVLVLKETEVVIPMGGMINLEAERKRIQREIESTQAAVARLEVRLNNRAFLTKAPAAIVDKERQKIYTLTDKLIRLKQESLDSKEE